MENFRGSDMPDLKKIREEFDVRREFIASEYETTDKMFDILKLNSQPQPRNKFS